mmetsp:Transcript_20596/g.58390  ORF Transcript_20596/g.58390 Transcript_20596/m.58390 type:complete len:259 (-) Transcript_20596:140-916(-)
MNYNHDTEFDILWAADQLRRTKLLSAGQPQDDGPIRRVTASLTQATLSPRADGTTLVLHGSVGPGEATLGCALSALAINSQDGAHCAQVCRDILAILSERDRVALHRELVHLKGLDSILDVCRHRSGEAVHVALQILDKLSRTSARDIAAAGGIDVVIRCVDIDGQAPRVIEAALKVLHGMSFDVEAKPLLVRRGVQQLAQGVAESRPPQNSVEAVTTVPSEEHVRSAHEAWQDVVSIASRLVTRLGGPTRSARARGA